MTVRWQTGEVRSAAVFLTDDDGAGLSGLTPSAVARRKDTGSLLAAPLVVGLGDGFYRVDLAAPPAVDVLVRVTYTAPTGSRQVGLEVEVGGYVDRLDVAVSSRASEASVTDLGSPAQASAVTAVDAALAVLVSATGSPAQAAQIEAVRVTVLAQVAAVLARTDVATSTRATPADVTSSSASTYTGTVV